MPKKSETISAFAAQRSVMETALDHPGMTYKLPTEGAAVSFVQQCNRLRANLRKQDQNLFELVPGHVPESKYDVLIIRRRANVITFDHNEIAGELYDAEGRPISPAAPAPQTSDDADLTDAIAEAAKNLNLDLDLNGDDK